MNTLFGTLERNQLDEIGFLDPISANTLDQFLNSAIAWISRSHPTNPRTVWFSTEQLSHLPILPPILKSRLVLMDAETLAAWRTLGPFPALFSSKSPGPDYSPLTPSLWILKPAFPARRALLLCHHCAVLPDIRRHLRALGIQAEFIWLCDGKPPTGDAWPSTLEHFTSSDPLLQGPLDGQISDELGTTLRARYDLIVTSHCMRYPVIFAAVGLPLLHINSTRFGNFISLMPTEFQDLQKHLQLLLASGQLTVIHNNRADAWYANQYLGSSVGSKVLRSLCEHPLRFRIRPPPGPPKFLLWDTRNQKRTPLYTKLLNLVGPSLIPSSSLEGWQPDDMLSSYTAVVHFPYNISTMSCFEQAAANIPLWLPTPRFLTELLLTTYNEISWFSFQPELRPQAPRPDQVHTLEILQEFVSRSDFTPEILGPAVLLFDSLEDLAARLHTTPYAPLTQASAAFHANKKKELLAAYKEILQSSLSYPSSQLP